ncbi:MAG: hypothetical protein DRJ38_04880 [Thermoprotei archaeon]|nr:MAG: hypothetical protein DRJ38_04880 [Thermoprotei archaeon]
MNFLRKIISKIWSSPEEKIANLTVNHAKLCYQTVEAFTKVIKEYCEGSAEKAEEHLMQVYSYEEEADGVRRKIIRELARGALPPLSREDFVRLAERMDLIADWAKEAARLLLVIPHENICRELTNECMELVILTEKSVKVLYDAVSIMMTDFKKSLQLIHKIESIEEKGDELYIKCLSRLERKEKECIGVPDLLIEKLIESFENILDACEEVGDLIKIIVIRALR